MIAPRKPSLDLAALRARLLAGAPSLWKSLEDGAALSDKAKSAGPAAGDEASLDRRRFLQLMGASLALAGLAACKGPPQEQIVPYVRSPEALTPGKPLFYA